MTWAQAIVLILAAFGIALAAAAIIIAVAARRHYLTMQALREAEIRARLVVFAAEVDAWRRSQGHR